jgi:hypothetical protein
MSEFGTWIPWAGHPENYRLSIADLVTNGTMDAEVAGTLWSAAAENLSFLCVAVPRNAGKTTVGSAILALRKPGTPLHFALGETREMEALRQRQEGGYIVIGEFSPWAMPSYIWGESVHQVFRSLRHGYSLQTSLHAPGVEPGIRVITGDIGISDEDAGHLKLVVYVEVPRPGVRRVAEVFEVDEVRDGAPVGRTLFRWDREHDRFDKLNEPSQFGTDRELLARRRDGIARLVTDGRTSIAEVEAMRAEVDDK